ncbi:hypothetical protein HDU93_004013 [Gonapodya sp. JEL0774]|nr:hypothetical protein HDU93_004013 [Gonapodya sp. JEL0774]
MAEQEAVVTVEGRIGIIRFNRPRRLNAFTEQMFINLMEGLKMLDEHPDTVFTVITGTDRFFSSGIDVLDQASGKGQPTDDMSYQERKNAYARNGSRGLEMMRLMIDHKKVLVVALNGPAVGGGAAWFLGVADLVYASDTAWIQIPFNALGLVPELGSGVLYPQHTGMRKTAEVLMFGKKWNAEEMERAGLAKTNGFLETVQRYLNEQLEVNDGISIMECKRLMVEPVREARMLAVYRAVDALTAVQASGRPGVRFKAKQKALAGE